VRRTQRGAKFLKLTASRRGRRILATCREEHEAVPDRVVKAEALQEMKDRAERVQDAPDREQPQAQLGRTDASDSYAMTPLQPSSRQRTTARRSNRPHTDAGAQTPMPKLAEYARFTGMLRSTQRRSLNLSPATNALSDGGPAAERSSTVSTDTFFRTGAIDRRGRTSIDGTIRREHRRDRRLHSARRTPGGSPAW